MTHTFTITIDIGENEIYNAIEREYEALRQIAAVPNTQGLTRQIQKIREKLDFVQDLIDIRDTAIDIEQADDDGLEPQEIERLEKSLETTLKKRPDLLESIRRANT